MEKHDYIIIFLIAGIIIVALVLAFNSKSRVVVGQNGMQKDSISVSGASTLTVEPNQAEVYVKIDTVEKTAQESKDKNSQTSSNVIKALKKEGVKDKDIETSQFFIYPKYEYNEVNDNSIRTSKQVLVGYEVTNVLKITTQDLDKVGKLIDIAVDNGANDIERISFDLTKEKEKEIKQQVMIAASDDAKEKAIALATNLGVRLGKPISVSESSFNYVPYNIYSGNVLSAKAAASEIVINPQKLDVSANINLVYEIKSLSR